jgi:hypothetical protein
MKWMLAFCLASVSLMLNAQTTLVDLGTGGVETNEPSIAIHPTNPNIQILGSNTAYFFQSTDAGYSWKSLSLSPPEGFYGDPVVHIDQQGRFYLLSLARNPRLEWPEQFDRIVLQSSRDGGASWISTGIGHRKGKMQDKPWIAMDEHKKSPLKGSLYVSWTEFDRYGSKSASDSSRIRFAWRRNATDSFQTTTISDSCGDATDDDGTLEGATCAVGAAGEVYCVWAGKGKLWFDMSLDGGKTWGKDQIVANQHTGWAVADIPALMRSNNMPFLKSDSKGRLYLIYGDKRHGDYDIFLKTSQDGGKSWSDDLRLNSDPQGNRRDQYMPQLCVDQITGKAYAIWYDRRHSANNIYTDIYLRPIVKGKPGKEYRVTNQSFCPPGSKVFFGDYIAVAAAKGQVRVAFTTYEKEECMSMVKVAVLTDRFIKKFADVPRQAYMEMGNLTDSAAFMVHFGLPGMKSGTLEITRGRQTVYKQLYDPLPPEEQEVLIPLKRLVPGVYRVSLSAKGRKMSRELYIGNP